MANTLEAWHYHPMRTVVLIVALLIAPAALAQQGAPPPMPGAGSRLEPWTNGRFIIRDATGRQVGTVEPYFNGWIIRDTMGRETGRVRQ